MMHLGLSRALQTFDEIARSFRFTHAHSSLLLSDQIVAQPGESADDDFMPKARPQEPIINDQKLNNSLGRPLPGNNARERGVRPRNVREGPTILCAFDASEVLMENLTR